MSGQPTEEQELFFDLTVNRLEDIANRAAAVGTALEEGDFAAAVYLMREGCGVGVVQSGETVWEKLTNNVEQIAEISDKLAEEEA